MKPRLEITDAELALVLGQHLRLGRLFAFLDADAYGCPGLESLAAGAGLRRVLPMTGAEPTQLPGMTLHPMSQVPVCSLATITCDRGLYHQGRDTIHLLAFDPLHPDTEAVLWLTAGSVVQRLPVRLDGLGAAHLRLQDLAMGRYTVNWDKGATDDAATFEVADFRLSPLTAWLAQSRMEDGKLVVELGVETYGAPVQGVIRISLHDADSTLGRWRVKANAGRAWAVLDLNTRGPHYVNVQLLDDPSRTATVPLSGSRVAERSPTLFSALGEVVTGSLLPRAGVPLVRGIYLNSAQNSDITPFRLERVDTGTARLTATQDVEVATILLLDPTHPSPDVRVVRDACPLHTGEVLDIDVAAPCGLLAIGAWVSGEPWEGWACVVTPSALGASVSGPESPRPDSPVPLHIHADRQATAAWVVVKDDRLLVGDTPSTRLGGGLKRWVQSMAERYRTGPARHVARVRPRSRETVVRTMVSMGLVTADAMEQALRMVDEQRRPIERILVDMNALSEGDLAQAMAIVLGVPFVDLDTMAMDPEIARSIPEHLAQRYKVIPVGQDGSELVLAMVDPFDVLAVEDIELITGFDVEPVFATEQAIVRAINRQFGVTDLCYLEETVKSLSTDDLADLVFDEEPVQSLSQPPGRKAVPAPEPPRPRQRAEVLFAGLVPLQDGEATITVHPGSIPTGFVADVLVLGPRDWDAVSTRFRTEKTPAVWLELPMFMHRDDRVQGRVRVSSQGGCRVRVTRDGQPVPLHRDEHVVGVDETLEAGQVQLTLAASPGEYVAEVIDETGQADRVEARVELPGQVTRLRQTPCWMSRGERLEKSDTVIGWRLVDDLQTTLATMACATMNYEYACCEQTGAKILAAALAYVMATDTGPAEASILAGVARERSMFLPGRGFKMYPQNADEPDMHYGPLTPAHLYALVALRGKAGLSPALQEAIDEAWHMANDATAAYGMTWPPTKADSPRLAYFMAHFGQERQCIAMVEYARQPEEAPRGALQQRCDAAWRAAILLRWGGDSGCAAATEMVNRVLRHVRPEGYLYSTLDTVAALFLVQAMQEKGVNGTGEVRDDGSTLEVVSGRVLVEVTRRATEDWAAVVPTLPVKVTMSGSLQAGEAVNLDIELPQGYQCGDLAEVYLPDALSRVWGGGQVKRFNVDFQGRQRISIELAATGITDGPQHLAVGVRNMYEEERVGYVDNLQVEVLPRAAETTVQPR